MANRFYVCMFSLVVGLAMSGCTLRESAKVSAALDQDFVNAHELFEISKSPRAKIAGGDTVSMSEGVWLGNKSMLLEHKNNLPSKYETDSGITILLSEPVTLQTLANM